MLSSSVSFQSHFPKAGARTAVALQHSPTYFSLPAPSEKAPLKTARCKRAAPQGGFERGAAPCSQRRYSQHSLYQFDDKSINNLTLSQRGFVKKNSSFNSSSNNKEQNRAEKVKMGEEEENGLDLSDLSSLDPWEVSSFCQTSPNHPPLFFPKVPTPKEQDAQENDKGIDGEKLSQLLWKLSSSLKAD